MNDIVRRYSLNAPEVYRLWTQKHGDRGRPVLREMAASAGISPNSLSTAMRGHGSVLPATAQRLAEVLECDVVDIATPSAFTAITPKAERKIVAITFAMDTELLAMLNRASWW